MTPRSLLPLATIVFSTPSFAAVTLPHVFSDHAVLQRDAPMHVWGTADPGEKVTVTFHGQSAAAVADDLGKWSVYLKPERAGGPYTLTASATNTVTIKDLLVGDVWFASGQSNMEIPLLGFPGSAVIQDAQQEIAGATHSDIRLLRVPKVSSSYEQRDQPATWTLCTPNTAKDFSAVGYFFARELAQKEHVPIGIIDSTWGGTPARAWVSLDSITQDAALMPELAARAEQIENAADVPAMQAREAREDAAAKAAGETPPQHPWHPGLDSWAPSYLFNGMVAPFTGFRIRGALWYQGEADSAVSLAPYYDRIFPALITDWRSRWNEGAFPFLFVQISSFTSIPQEHWGIVRAAQGRTLKLANTAMAVSLDVGLADNVHPPDKQTVAHRLALGAEALSYGSLQEWSGPTLQSADAEGPGMRLTFSHGEGLAAKGGPLQGFEVAGSDHHYYPATAAIQSGTVWLQAQQVAQPMYVRYAWANSALNANLYNSAGLPTGTFTTERHLPGTCNESCAAELSR